MRQLDPQLPLYNVKTMDQVLYTATARPRFLTFLLVLFAGLAVLLAAIGIYGIMSYTVAQGTREIGIRVALGAQSRDLFQMVLGRGLRLTLIGIIVYGRRCVTGDSRATRVIHPGSPRNES
jgi:ABC-type antimicrobial peptide transport system permease subunit